jgi:hypothetical protein
MNETYADKTAIAIYIRFPDSDAVPFGQQHTTLFNHILKRALTGNGLIESEPVIVLELSGRLIAVAEVTNRTQALMTVRSCPFRLQV